MSDERNFSDSTFVDHCFKSNYKLSSFCRNKKSKEVLLPLSTNKHSKQRFNIHNASRQPWIENQNQMSMLDHQLITKLKKLKFQINNLKNQIVHISKSFLQSEKIKCWNLAYNVSSKEVHKRMNSIRKKSSTNEKQVSFNLLNNQYMKFIQHSAPSIIKASPPVLKVRKPKKKRYQSRKVSNERRRKNRKQQSSLLSNLLLVGCNSNNNNNNNNNGNSIIKQNGVFNLSEIPLDSETMNILSLGGKFIPHQSKCEDKIKQSLTSSLLDFCRRLDSMHSFNNASTSSFSSSSPFFKAIPRIQSEPCFEISSSPICIQNYFHERRYIINR
jgi:hypothetical protein